MTRFGFSLSALSLLALGCGTEPSSNLATRELAVHVEAQAQPSGVTHVSVRLARAQGVTAPVTLSDEDMLLARLGDLEAVLEPQEDERGPGVSYVATLPGNAEGLPVLVRLERDRHEDASARVILPAPIEITSPHGDINFFWADVDASVDVAWRGGNHADEVEISYAAECDTVSTEDSQVESDSGSSSVEFPFGDDYERCDFDMTVKRRNVGVLSGGWQGEAYGTTADRTTFEID